ncbi:hypothetical protein ABZX69_32160 [Streptomyces sp. NPDC004074]|uniref:hypothetical protein n=1 Tax=Streptomyces sp. NPDC004074 TaxID=3154277 RepID=UPI0033B7C245
MRTEPDRLTQAAGHAVAAAIRAINTHGLFDPAITPALEAATALFDLAMRCGATADDIRRAGGLPA